ncbi:MAG: acetylglutamate kinase [Alphaproteobacteria bacterium GM7ARS4]|nr:acetylglutamate kinase [Alphaproteobacteria bacterium GM7ARS4]
MPASPSAVSPHEEARILAKALPYMRLHRGKNFVIKLGGAVMGDKNLMDTFATDIILLQHIGICPFIVHGGGPQIGAMLERLKIKSAFIDGLRITDKETALIVEMVLAGTINKEIVSLIHHAGGNVIGISGKDGRLMTAKKVTHKKRDHESHIENVLDLGFVGEPHDVNPDILTILGGQGVIPVIAPVASGDDGLTYNINADTAAGAIAVALRAKRFMLLTDVQGIKDKGGAIMPTLDIEQARTYMRDGTIHGGMIPKVDTCLRAVEQGVEAAVILDGRKPHALLLEIFTEHGAGTIIKHTPCSP